MNDSTHNFDKTNAAADDLSPAETMTRPDLPPPPEPARSNLRRRLFLILGAIIVIAAVVYLVMRLLAPPSQSTDDAYVGGDVVAITAREGGTVLALGADNTQQVSRGAKLIELDPVTQDVAVAAAEADLGRAVRSIRADRSAVDEAGAEIAQAQANLDKARSDYSRRKTAARDGAVSGEELAHAQDAVTTSQAALTLSTARRAQAESSIAGTDVANNPAVLAAVAKLRSAVVSRSYMDVFAPVSGVVAQRTVQLGQRVAAGTPLMAVVPLDALWVDANFRETQLQQLRVGQPVEILTDVYGGKVIFHGKVLGLGAGSGSAFSLLPAQNATGNWIKIVQRVPVRIALDRNELRDHPLRIGLSVTAKVDTSNQSGPMVANSTPPAGGRQASFEGNAAIDARVRQIIAANIGRAK